MQYRLRRANPQFNTDAIARSESIRQPRRNTQLGTNTRNDTASFILFDYNPHDFGLTTSSSRLAAEVLVAPIESGVPALFIPSVQSFSRDTLRDNHEKDSADYEFPFLEEVYTPAEQPKIDFVFVHGLNPRGRTDHAFETWTHQNGTFWPRDYLPQDIPQARVFVYGYNSYVTNPQAMSNASVKDHANTLLNLLDMERSPQVNARPPKIIFIGHSLGGLVIKQALLNAQEDPKYTSIRTGTYGLVFFGTPHHGTKGVELGKIAAKVAKFVSKGHATNDLLDCLEHNSLFTRQMSSRFCHQLEDYRVISFIEGKEVLLGGAGPASISHLVVDEESAVLGLPGNRETRLKLDADHSQMCKVGNRGAMYRLIKGNIKQIADQLLVTEQGYIPQPSPSPRAGPPLPPPRHTNSSAPYPPPGIASQQATQRVIGALYNPVDNDPRSVEAAEHKNKWKWDDARRVEYTIFQEHLRTLGADHHSTLQVGYNLAEIDLESGYIGKAAEWCQWVSNNSQRVFDKRHPLTMRAESLMGEILVSQGKQQEGESVCANVLARQQMTIGEDDVDTLETRRRLANAYSSVERRDEGIATAKKRTESLKRLLGENHIKTYASVLDTIELIVAKLSSNNNNTVMAMALYQTGTDEIVNVTQEASRELNNLLGPRHPLSIRSLRLLGACQIFASGGITEPSETLRRALATAEENLGSDNPETIQIVIYMGLMYAKQSNPYSYAFSQQNLDLALPWFRRYLDWARSRDIMSSPDPQAVLGMLGNMYMAKRDYQQAQNYYEQLVNACQKANIPVPADVPNMLELCRMNTRLMSPYRNSSGIESLLSSFKRL
ncbi:LipA and NB-ARC domain protein [Aspergillus nomiae NRRL 13137]|uniref:LipA and NB-ARC domain protein n=1 Tax=Aspergillus nomiae NRRL (strain ATCC 15546 / NRRL 13137 / CBS 260.88 / M93) TaxID=1509407 RepID=A0A0L1JD49_ASPN3|nr:LipA and NB-ARC domain protein [Aspergillus nomiae NRRL 13137]KNG89709.1 LipA and NB-ARC domain protein [Aspergillus nomiae NRRL 13137]